MIGKTCHGKTILFAVLSLATGVLLADTCTWSGAQDGYWTNSANWVEGRVPGQYYEPGGALTGGLQDKAVFGDDLSGNKITTISFDGVYSISNLYTQGSTTRYTYGATADEFIPIQCWGSFVGSRYADTLVPTIACKLRLGIDCTDVNYGSETVTIQTENPNETLVIGPWGYRTKRSDITNGPKEPGLAIRGRGHIRFEGAYNSGWGNYPHTTVAMSGGTLTFTRPATFRTLQFNTYDDSLEPTTVYIGENASISPASSYNCLVVNTEVRMHGPGPLKVIASYQTTRGDGYGNYPGWFFSGFEIRDGKVFRLDAPLQFAVWNGYATNEQLENMKIRLVATGSGTFIKTGPSYLEGEVKVCNMGWDKTNLRYVSTASPTIDVVAMGLRDNSVTGSLGCVDFLLGDNAVLRHSGPGEITDRSLFITGVVVQTSGRINSKATFEFNGTGTMTLASSVTLRGVNEGTLSLKNSTDTQAVADCTAGEGVDVSFVKGPWRFGENFSCDGDIRMAGTAELTIDRSLTFTNLYVDSGTQTVFVQPEATLSLSNFTCAAGATVDFEVLASDAKVIAANRSVSGTVKLNGLKAKFNDDGTLDFADDIANHAWKWSENGSWTESARWLNGLPTESSFNDVVAPGADYMVKVDGDDLRTAGVGDAGCFTLTNLTVRNLGTGTATLLVTNGAEMTFVSRMQNAASAPLHLEQGSRLEIVDAKVILRDHGRLDGSTANISPLQNAGGTVEVRGNGQLVHRTRERTDPNSTNNQDGIFSFGTGHYVFRDNSQFLSIAPEAWYSGCGWSTVTYNYFQPSASGDLKVEFLDSSRYNLSQLPWITTLGGNGRHVELVFDTDCPDEQKLGSYFYVAVADGLSEVTFRRGAYQWGTYHTGIGSPRSVGTIGDALFSTGRVEIASGVAVWSLNNNEQRGVVVGSGLPMTKSRGQAFVRGELETAGSYSQNRGSFYVGAGPCAEGVMRQTGGTFSALSESSPGTRAGTVAVGICGGRGTLTIDDGAFATKRPVYIGGATTNDLLWVGDYYNKNGALLATYHDARGEVAVNGGSFTTTKDVVIGADGTGSLVLSGTGTVVAASITVSNTVGQAASYLKFTADAQGRMGKLQADTLAFAEGSKLVLDLTAWPEKLTRAPLATLTNPVVGWDNVKDAVEMSGNVPRGATLMFTNEGRKISFVVQKGTLLVFR